MGNSCSHGPSCTPRLSTGGQHPLTASPPPPTTPPNYFQLFVMRTCLQPDQVILYLASFHKYRSPFTSPSSSQITKNVSQFHRQPGGPEALKQQVGCLQKEGIVAMLETKSEPWHILPRMAWDSCADLALWPSKGARLQSTCSPGGSLHASHVVLFTTTLCSLH